MKQAATSLNSIRFRRTLKKHIKIILFMLPAMLPLLLFWYWPAVDTVYLSFTDWDMMTPTYNMVGFENYIDVLTSDDFYQALSVTVIFSVVTVTFSIALGLLLAVFIYQNRILNGLLKFLYFSPWVTPLVAVSIIWVFMFDKDGIINYLLSFLGIPKTAWLGSSKTALIPIMVVTIWTSVGWNMIFYLGALSRVPKDLYEAAEIDGVSRVAMFRKITLPFISPTTLFLVVVSTIGALQAYSQIQVMTQGGPSGSTRTLLYLYYLNAFEFYKVGKATAIAVILIIITAILSALQFYISNRHVYYE